MRYLLLALVASACSNPSIADSPPVVTRNFVCERVATIQDDAKTPADKRAECKPEYSGDGTLFTHTARITQPTSATVVCGLNAGQLAMVCGPLEVQPAPAPKAEPAPQAPAKK